MAEIRQLDSKEAGFSKQLEELLAWESVSDGEVNRIVDDTIAMMKCSDVIKSKAIDKLKEIKGTRESSAKAQQYLDGLLKIPFGIFESSHANFLLQLFFFHPI